MWDEVLWKERRNGQRDRGEGKGAEERARAAVCRTLLYRYHPNETAFTKKSKRNEIISKLDRLAPRLEQLPKCHSASCSRQGGRTGWIFQLSIQQAEEQWPERRARGESIAAGKAFSDTHPKGLPANTSAVLSDTRQPWHWARKRHRAFPRNCTPSLKEKPAARAIPPIPRLRVREP